MAVAAGKSTSKSTNKSAFQLRDFLNHLSLAQLPWFTQAWREWNQQQMQNRLGHAYLLQASKGIGVEVLVREIAQFRLCQSPVENNGLYQACGQCSSCHLFSLQQHPDFYHLACAEDKKEISIAQIRELIEKQNQKSHQGGFKVIWIEEVEKLSISAFNALLKSLEEPGEDTLYLLTSSQVASLPATIRSRCQKLTVAQPSLANCLQWLQQKLPQQDEALLKRALRVNWSAPLHAYQWIADGLFNEERQWHDDIQAVLSGQKNINKVVQTWLKLPAPENVFDYFYVWVLARIRKLGYQSTQGVFPAQGEPSDERVMNAKVTLQQWLQFQLALGWAQNDWQGNANQELLLENLLMEWQQLAQQEQAGTLVHYDYQSVFQSSMNRGDF